ncbi:uncharacterized protein LOC124940354 [Impatiens glandulifera]|uniref:uncharacterized protein LOC124940354 n=1 Tax=Impatiens glandulifera TaxID=253017 RepID=UPI001FB175C5|nr:uncharacterized protein LOC124940354 [Impatiens glandulifera]
MVSSNKLSMVLLLSIFLQEIMGEMTCENLPVDVCAFSVASSGKRCLLENFKNGDGQMEFQCSSSEVVVPMMADHIESQSCIAACGVDRKTVGISSDALLEPQFTSMLCSKDCFFYCPNIVDLYFNLAAGEGVFLPDLCEKQRTNPHRAMLELSSSSAGQVAIESAPGPASVSAFDLSIASAPAFAPAPARHSF